MLYSVFINTMTIIHTKSKMNQLVPLPYKNALIPFIITLPKAFEKQKGGISPLFTENHFFTISPSFLTSALLSEIAAFLHFLNSPP